MEEIYAGQRFGRWTVLEKSGDGIWQCVCRCGTRRNVPDAWLLSGFSKSCGCGKQRARDLRGQKFGLLTAIEPVARKATDGSIRWRCRCDCGSTTVVSSNKLRRGHTSSCGCMSPKAAREARSFVDGACIDILFTDKLRANNTSGRTGVYRKRSKWAAYITVGKKMHWLGSYGSYEEAAVAREEAESEWRERLLGKPGSDA